MIGTCHQCGAPTELVTFDEGAHEHRVYVMESTCTGCGRVSVHADGEMRAVARFLQEWCSAVRRPATLAH